ncbi:signal peptide peptidase SppA [Sphingomonas sp. LaA6.9]|uniref:signal peptide peptidase SppA n=1 Tax=Sphingomonas sp. LaA6.9 TaxID=2919914 RepID=UPI001F4FC6C6|nr:signal peptide peptidase SppA [Sphingomonas sp. LaA6.9]MCJ8158159.1 signal peptide peptidase SppA [Sphingomonas sp. LaA6.9]
MSFVRGAWKLLVGVKDALVLLFMLLFFVALWAALSARPNPANVTTGALLVDLSGTLVEQPEEVDPLSLLAGATDAVRQHRLRDVVRALETAATDDRIKVVVLDLDSFVGGGQAAIARAAEAIDTIRKAKKPVLAYATGYSDDSYQLAAHASEVWLDPMGLTLFTGPGGSRLYYKGLIDRLGVTTKVYRVGTYKSAIEPYTRADQSPEAKQADQALAGALWQNWQDDVAKARPKAQLAAFIAQPQQQIAAAGGDLAQAALRAGLVDKLGDRIAFGKRVAEIAGADDDKGEGAFKHTRLTNWIAANPAPSSGDAIGVITVAGEIVDGEALPGTAGGDSISKLILKGLAEEDLKALVVRVDSPGGSVLASEKIRQAILQAKAEGLPVVVSMGSVAASGGYWVSTPADRIFAEPSTITGSIGVFGIIPTFENALAKVGVTSDGVTTTPLSGQPDIIGGTNATFDAVIQSSIENTYARFLGLVSKARGMPVQKVDGIAQGRVWDGGTARQLGLVDQFGGIEDAIAEAARRAKLDPAKVHAEYLEHEPGFAAMLFQGWTQDEDDSRKQADLLARLAQARMMTLFRAVSDAERLTDGPVVRAQCLECPVEGGKMPVVDSSIVARMLGWLAR